MHGGGGIVLNTNGILCYIRQNNFLEITDISGDKKVHVVITQDVESNETRKFDVGGIFIAIGHDPNTQIFKGQLDMDDINYLKVRNHTYTSVEGVFAAGDVHDHRYRQAVTAAGFGCMAAIDVVKYLEEKHYKSTN